VTGPRRLSQAISEGDGISLIVAVTGPEEAQQAEARGAEALLVDGDVEAIRAACSLPILTAAGSAGDARIVRAGDEDVELRDSVEVVVQVEKEDELEEALERLDPELFVLAAGDAEDPVERVLDLLPDLPAGKLAIADVERAGVDAVLVRELL
jgi:hypothetical protein